jgi:hypothetical protein
MGLCLEIFLKFEHEKSLCIHASQRLFSRLEVISEAGETGKNQKDPATPSY